MTETIVIPEAPAAGPDRPDYSPWVEAILIVARHYRLDVSPESVRLASTNSEGRAEEVVRHMARQAGLSVKFAHYDRKSLSRWRTPLLVQLRDGQVGVIESVSEQGELGIAYSGDQGLQSRIDPAVLAEQALRTVILRPIQPLSDVRTDDYIKPYDEHWFRRIVLSDLRPYRQVMLASLVANLLGMAGVLFSMQVYDRVIPGRIPADAVRAVRWRHARAGVRLRDAHHASAHHRRHGQARRPAGLGPGVRPRPAPA
jgi:ATP-binding cassette subfamily C protein LapB